eukprot:1191395-Prorocentrum_minimum.AAC.8
MGACRTQKRASAQMERLQSSAMSGTGKALLMFATFHPGVLPPFGRVAMGALCWEHACVRPGSCGADSLTTATSGTGDPGRSNRPVDVAAERGHLDCVRLLLRQVFLPSERGSIYRARPIGCRRKESRGRSMLRARFFHDTLAPDSAAGFTTPGRRFTLAVLCEKEKEGNDIKLAEQFVEDAVLRAVGLDTRRGQAEACTLQVHRTDAKLMTSGSKWILNGTKRI